MEQLPIPLPPQLDLPKAEAEPDVPARVARRRRRWPLVVALLAAAMAVGWLALPWLVGRWIVAMMEEDTGVAASVTVTELTSHGLVMAPLVLGDDLRAERVEVRWRLPELLSKRLDQVSLSGVRARARFDGDGLSLGAVDRLIESQHMRVERLALPGAQAEVTVPWGTRHLWFDAEKQGDLLRAEGDISDLLRGQPLIGGEPVRLTMTAHRTDAGGMTADMAVSGKPLSGKASLQWAHGRLRATLATPISLALAALPAGTIAAAPEVARPLLSAPLTMTVKPIGLGPHLQVTTQADGPDLTTALRVELRAGKGHAAIESAGTIRLGRGGLPEGLALERLSVELTNLPYGGARLDGALRLADVAGQGQAGAAKLRLMLLAHDLEIAGLRSEEAALALTGRLALEDGKLVYALSEPGSLYLKTAQAPGVTARQPVELAIAGDGRIEVAGPPGARRIMPSLTLSAPRLVSEIAGHAVTTEKMRATIGGALGGDKTRPTLEVTAETAVLGGLDLTLKRPVARLAQMPDGPRLTLVAEQVTHGDTLPLALNAWLQPGDHRFSCSLVDGQGRVDLTIAGRIDPSGRAGSATVNLKPVTFQPGGLQPRALFPNLTRTVQGLNGTMALSGGVAWNGLNVKPDFDLLLKDMDAKLAGVTLRKLNTVVKLTGLNPLNSPPGQMLAVAVVEAGVPLTDGQLQFQLSGGRLHVEHASTRLAGGNVTLGDFVYDPQAGKPQRFALEVSSLDLARLVELSDLDGLSATGKLSGNVPLSLRPDRVAIEDARLISVESGAIRYRPKEPPAFFTADDSTRLVLKAFDNFVYDKMTMTLYGSLGGELSAGLHITGGNPDLYGGYPIEFNLNLAGKLDRIIDEALVGYQIPDQIKQRMSWFRAR